MKFNFKEKDLFLNKETETISTLQELELEELSDEEATAIRGGAGKRKANSTKRTVITEADATNDFPASEYYAAAGYWGG